MRGRREIEDWGGMIKKDKKKEAHSNHKSGLVMRS